jgi:hypothetical protein
MGSLSRETPRQRIEIHIENLKINTGILPFSFIPIVIYKGGWSVIYHKKFD